jgi:hypothetical protein
MHPRPYKRSPAHFFGRLHPVLTADYANYPDTDDSSIEYIQCVQHTFNRTTNLVMDNFLLPEIQHFPHGTYPATIDASYKYMPPELSDIIQKVVTFEKHFNYFQIEAISAMSLHSSTHFSKIKKVATNPFDRQQDSKQSFNNTHPTNLGSFLLFPFTYCQLVNGFGDKVHPHQHVMPSAQEFCLTLSTLIT